MSKMISSIWKNANKFIKEKFSKSEFNFNLIDLKLVTLLDTDTIDMDKSKLNPLTKGLLLDESKEKNEQINFNSDSNYNKLETSLKNIKKLDPIENYQNNDTTWFDYFKKIIFGNGKQEYLNSFFKFFIKHRNLNKQQNNNFSFNCNGKYIAFINQNGYIIISDTQSNNIGYFIESEANEGVNSFSWDIVNPNKLFYSINNFFYECIFNESNKKLFKNKKYSLSKISKFINCFPSPKGDLLILLYEKEIEVYDIFQNLLFSKLFLTFKFKNAIYDNKSSVFIVYTEKEIIIFNLETFDFKTYKYLPGNILKLINNPENDNIYVFTIDKQNELNELLYMFILADISISSDINLNFNSYQNYDNFYRQYLYVLRPDIFAFQYNLKLCNAKILDVCLSPNGSI